MMEQPVDVFQFKCFILPLSKKKKKKKEKWENNSLCFLKKKKKQIPLDIVLGRKLSLSVRSIIIASFVRSIVIYWLFVLVCFVVYFSKDPPISIHLYFCISFDNFCPIKTDFSYKSVYKTWNRICGGHSIDQLKADYHVFPIKPSKAVH